MKAVFIGDLFSWRRTGLAVVGEKGKSKREIVCSEDTWLVGRGKVKKLHVD